MSRGLERLPVELKQSSRVMRGLDPRVHLLAKKMDCRVEPAMTNSTLSENALTEIIRVPNQRGIVQLERGRFHLAQRGRNVY
jgi:hypothetical protein